MTNRRVLGLTEARMMSVTGLFLLVLALCCWIWPGLIAFPLAVVMAWIAVTLFVKAWRLRKKRMKS